MNKNVLVAGSTGYLGQFVIKELKKQGYGVRVLCRNDRKIQPLKPYIDEVFIGEATQPETLANVCQNIDIVFSALGITKQKDNLTYMDVDYQGNKNLLNEALTNPVSKFMYISVLNANKLKHLEMVKAKEKFVDELKASEIESIIIRPNGFFADMTEIFKMAQKGRVYLFGDGQYRANPIHGADLAQACVAHLDKAHTEIDIGGPEILTQNEIAKQAFAILEKDSKITYIPLWLKNLILNGARTFTSSKTYGPLEFFMTVLVRDMLAPKYGNITIRQYFQELNEKSNNPTIA